MIISFGIHKGSTYEEAPEDYLCWICAAWKGGSPAKHAGERLYRPSDEAFYEARRILKERGYDIRPMWPVKGETDWKRVVRHDESIDCSIRYYPPRLPVGRLEGGKMIDPTNKQDQDKLAAVLMGIHLHTQFIYPNGHKSLYKCADTECEFYKHQSIEPLSYDQFSASTPDGELTYEFRKWMESEIPETWEDYLSDMGNIDDDENTHFNTILLNARLSPSNLFRYLVETVDSWGMMKDPDPCFEQAVKLIKGDSK